MGTPAQPTINRPARDKFGLGVQAAGRREGQGSTGTTRRHVPRQVEQQWLVLSLPPHQLGCRHMHRVLPTQLRQKSSNSTYPLTQPQAAQPVEHFAAGVLLG